MQDIHMIGPSGRIFTGVGGTNITGGGTVDRRLRQNHLQNQALKCPRCDSLNTKFCYYNNYNLSQPRHFCKSCRRYWTKGGVLRNVPVGGGCRKSSKQRSAASKLKSATHHHSSENSSKLPKSNNNNNNSNPSSESSSLTGTTTTNNNATTTATAAAEKVTLDGGAQLPATTEHAVSSSSLNAMFGFGEQKYVFPQIGNPNFSTELISGADGSSFADIGNFPSLMTSANNDPTVVNMSGSYDDVSAFDNHNPQQEYHHHHHHHQMEQWQLNPEAEMQQEMSNSEGRHQFGDPTAGIDQSGINGGSEPLDWHQQQQQHMFAVDQGYWGGQQQWPDEAADHENPSAQHHHLYFALR